MKQPLIYLASTSPRRVQLLTSLGIPFTQVSSDYHEYNEPGKSPTDIVLDNSYHKARAVLSKIDSGYIIGADTIVVCDDEIFGKPDSDETAQLYLSKLSSRSHVVLTGVTIFSAETQSHYSDVARTEVTFRSLEDEEIRAYIATGEPGDKAGAYAIQGKAALFITAIKGCHSNVIGLPLATLHKLFKQLEVPLHLFW